MGPDDHPLIAVGLMTNRFAAEIKRLSERYQAPMFPPHVTLLGGIKASDLETVKSISRDVTNIMQKVPIELDRVGYGELFHQTVYILVKKSPQLEQYHTDTRRAFGFGDSAAYMPHLSLIYSNIDEMTRKQISEEEQAVLFPQDDGNASDLNFECGRVELWYTPAEDKGLQSWKKIEEYIL